MKRELRESDGRMWVVAGVAGAVILGIALIPLRGYVSASNLAFVFLAFTILVAELGGRTAALTAALLSAVSLNFFLTEPYLTLNIDKREDLIAFFALAGCGLIAAMFGRQRTQFSADAKRTAEDLDLLQHLVDRLREHGSLEEALGELRQHFGLSAILLRDGKEHVIAASPAQAAPRMPRAELSADTLFSVDANRQRLGLRGFRLPEGGGRLRVPLDSGTVLLDLWEGDEAGLDLDERQTLGVAAYLLALEAQRRVPRGFSI